MPRRRCAGCGRIAPKPELVRFALERRGDGATRHAVLDAAGTLPGRGAYVCRDPRAGAPVPACLQGALRKGGLARTLRGGVSNTAELLESVTR